MLNTVVSQPEFKGMPMQQLQDAEQTSLYVTADYHHLTLSSHFQPIFSISHRRPVGYEGLIRAVDPQKHPHSPLELLAIPQNGVENLSLDRLMSTVAYAQFCPSAKW